MKQYRRIFRIISRIAAGLAVISWFGLGEHQGNYVPNRPREPEPSLGFTVPYETKGTIVCVSNADRELDKWLWIAIVSAFGIAMGGGALSGELRKMLNPDRASN